MAIRDLDAADESYLKIVEAMIKLLPPEHGLRTLFLEKRLAGVPPEQRLAGLDRDQRALALPLDVLRVLPEEYLRSLSPEVEKQLRQRLRAAGD